MYRQTEMHTAEPLKCVPSSFNVDILTEILRRFKLPGTDEIPAKLIQTGGEALYSETHELIHSITNMEELPQKWNRFISEPVYKICNKTNCSYY
jgi:hypothetical protein